MEHIRPKETGQCRFGRTTRSQTSSAAPRSAPRFFPAPGSSADREEPEMETMKTHVYLLARRRVVHTALLLTR